MITEFTQNSDIKMIVEEKQICTNQMKSILRKKGIFCMVYNTKELANEIYPIYFGSADIQRMKELMDTESSYEKSSLISIISSDKSKSLDDLLDDIGEGIQKYRSYAKKYNIKNVCIDSDGSIKLKMSYIKKVKGRVSLIKNKVKELDATFKKDSDDSRILIDIRQNDNSDLKEFNKFLEELNNQQEASGIYELQSITLDKLTNENKIKFYDEMIKYRYSDWRIDDIKGIDVKKDEEPIDLDEDDEEDKKSINSKELLGINSAVFKGNSIRDAGIVKTFQEQGFCFTSMKIKYSYNKKSQSFVVDINFKGTDNVKINIVNSYDNTEGREIKYIIPMEEQEIIIKEFQEAVNKVYKELINSQIPSGCDN